MNLDLLNGRLLVNVIKKKCVCMIEQYAYINFFKDTLLVYIINITL